MTKTTEELTEDWKARKLKPGSYYVRLSNGNLDVAKLSRFNRFYGISYHFEVEEILAPCDYGELQRLKAIAEKGDTTSTDIIDCNIRKENMRLQAEINRLRKAINSALNFMACPDDLSGLTGKCNDQAAFDVLREALNNESEE